MIDYDLLKMAGVAFGSGKGDLTGEKIKALGGTRALIVTDKGIVNLGIAAKVAASLERAGITYEGFDDVMPEPTDALCLELADRAAKLNFDTIIGLGGGSPIDAAKAVGLIAGIREIEEIEDLHEYSGIGSRAAVAAKARRNCILITIPTTAGTGAETTQSSVLTSSRYGMKYSFMGPASMADLCIIDPLYTVGMPKMPTVHTGLDALAHATENLVGITNNDYSEIMMLECIRRILKYLPVCVEDPQNVEAREQMAWAAHNAQANGGVPNGHAIAHAIGSKYHIVHAHACMLVLPMVIRHFAHTSADQIAKLADLFGCEKGASEEETAENVAQAIKKFYKSFGYTNMKETLASKGVNVDEETFAESLVDFTLDDFKSHLWNPVIHDDPEKVKAVCRLIYTEE